MTDHVVDLGFVSQHFEAGAHMCLIYKDDEEREKIISQYLLSGLRDQEKVTYFAYKTGREEIMNLLENSGIVVNSENFEVADATDSYCPHHYFDPDEMLESLKELYNNTIKMGYKNCRLSGEMQWALDPIPGTNRLMEYEAMVNNVVKTHPVTSICQYDARLFDGEVIVDCLKVHPYVIVNGQVVENPYYLTPEEFLKHK
ncbi:MAG: MEDS domain-containing protein [Bacteroidota bacterium]